MSNSKFEYVKSFENKNDLLKNTYIVIRIDGKGFTKFTDAHQYKKPNEIKGIRIMVLAAISVMESFPEIFLAYGQSDEFSFAFKKNAKLYNRRHEKILTNVVSQFTSAFVFNWSKVFVNGPELKYPPCFDGRVVLYPSFQNLKDYFSWRYVDCHINDLYNTTFWALVQEGKISKDEAHQKEKKAFGICEQKIRNHNLQMKLVNVEYTFDNNKILFYFTADGRVDFRELVKDLAYVFRTRIELRQIGVRDEAKMLGGLGICGRPFCCNTFMGEFQPVSIKMAKEQGMSLNPVKISGTCGRLMCCLKYEQDVYSSLLKTTPKIGAIVDTPDGKGDVIDLNLITGTLTVSLHKSPDAAAHTYNVSEVKVIKDGQIRLDRSEIEKLKKLEKD